MFKNLPFLLILSLIGGSIEVDISVPSFPDLARDLQINENLTQMTIAINFLGFCISSMLYGPLSESYGRRPLMIYGNAIMLIGAIGCLIAPTIEWLLFARFVQGIGASTSAVLVFAMVADVYSGYSSIKLIGTMNFILTIFISGAPVIGSLITELVGWRGIYAIVAFISLISWLLLYYNLPETKEGNEKISFTKIFSNYLILISSKDFLCLSLVLGLDYAGYMCFIAGAPFLYTSTFELTILDYAIYQGIIIATFAIFSIYAGKITEKIGQRNSILLGIIAALLGGILMVLGAITIDKPVYFTTFSMMIIAIGAAIYYPVIFTIAMELFPTLKGTASSFLTASKMLVCSAFVALTSYFYDSTLLPLAIIVFIIALLMAVITHMWLKSVSLIEAEA